MKDKIIGNGYVIDIASGKKMDRDILDIINELNELHPDAIRVNGEVVTAANAWRLMKKKEE